MDTDTWFEDSAYWGRTMVFRMFTEVIQKPPRLQQKVIRLSPGASVEKWVDVPTVVGGDST